MVFLDMAPVMKGKQRPPGRQPLTQIVHEDAE
jgi:hypothetical protein